ncbi:hypothetical protein BFF78_12220 [Streptomyces fodineus]|uniref:Uncharacterized protein n=1 Tax=Streptomyces fodineus TaxID=1904616 RepID=A0A1D7Y7X7_9ACTN|nr:hypothetical protein [Streptomyces fodineus]AOR31715.1 hypothetical protein BFF78_12220 [Streptomyces fodineus]
MSHREQARVRVTAATSARLSRMCEDLAEAEELVGPEFTPVLERLRSPDASEHQVRTALAELEELLRQHGLVGPGAVARGELPAGGYQPLPGLGPGRPLEEVYVCPGDLCDRVEIPRPGPPRAPLCAVWACPLPRFRMDRER